MRTRRNWLLVTTAAIVICAGLAGIIYAYASYAANRAAPTRPVVTITGTFPDETGVSGQPLIVFGQASDPDGVAQVELWINGQQVATQTNSEEETLLPFMASQAWIPSGPGTYLMVLRAHDRRGFTGDSDPFAIQVVDRQFNSEEEIGGEYVTLEGDTIEDIAATFGLSPEELRELNPEVGDLTPGSTLDVPHVPEEGDTTEETALGSGGADIPLVDPPSPAPMAEEVAIEAEPLSEDWWVRLPLPSNFSCLFRPESCRTAIEAIAPPFPAPDGLSVTTGSCFNVLSWQDNSENELGFRVYRFTMRPRFRFELLALLSPSPGSGARVSYNDNLLPVGAFFYAVVAYNAGGQTWSEASEEVANDCPFPEASGPQALVVEGLEMEVPAGFERLYCYVSLNGSPFERIPYGASNFVRLEEGSWDIAEHFSGRNKRSVIVSRDYRLPVRVECMGWRGEELVNLGRFEQWHPPEEWDGRSLAGSPEGGGFTITYRILPSFAAGDESGRTEWPLVDPKAHSPYDLHATPTWQNCTRLAGATDTCAEVAEQGLSWSFEWIIEGERIPSNGFKVYRRLEGERAPRVYYTVLEDWPNSAPLFAGDCSDTVLYSVSAIIGVDPVTGEEIQSPLSAELEVPPSCTTLTITLDRIWVYGVRDGDSCFGPHCQRYEAYGWISINGQRVTWNDHCDPGLFEGCVISAPETTSARQASSVSLSSAWLNQGDGFRQENNEITIPIRDGEALNLAFQFWDHDSTSGDDLWCGFATSRPTIILEGRSASDWSRISQEAEYDQGFNPDSDVTGCILHFHVQGE